MLEEESMRMLGCAAIAALLAMTDIAVVDAAGALAVGQCSRNGRSYDYADQADANARAIAECAKEGDDTCRVVATIRGACAAFALDGDCGAQGWGTGSSRAEAERTAIEYCARYGGANCEVHGWVCDGGR